MVIAKRIFFILLAILIGDPSFAEVYKWVDEKGAIHFTDDISQIPVKYRSTIEGIWTEDKKNEIKPESELPPEKKGDAFKDRLGRGEEYWKARVEELKNKKQALQEQVEHLRVKYNELTERFNSSRSSAERGVLRKERDEIKTRMDEMRIQIDQTREMLERKIPEEAQLYGARPEWVTP